MRKYDAINLGWNITRHQKTTQIIWRGYNPFIVQIIFFFNSTKSTSSLRYFQVAKTLAKIKGKDSVKDELPQPDHRSLSQIEKDENSLSREELIEHNEAWSAVEKDELFVPEYTKFNSDHINKEATEGVALKMPIFFCVIKSMDLLSGHDINCELIDMKGNGFLPNAFKMVTKGVCF